MNRKCGSVACSMDAEESTVLSVGASSASRFFCALVPSLMSC